jgi:hypothetical protein
VAINAYSSDEEVEQHLCIVWNTFPGSFQIVQFKKYNKKELKTQLRETNSVV